MKLDILQQDFVEEVLHGNTHLILTGRAGTGKSTALCAAVADAKAVGMDVLVMAPTAMAASIHRDAGLESGTIHHALRWNPMREPLPRKLLSVCGSAVDWSGTPDQDRLLVVDEASMVGLWLFEILARDLGDGKDPRPFDGRRLVVVGDWAQLPPVVGSEEMAMAKAMPELKKFGPPDGCIFYHPMFRVRPPVAVILQETHRANGEWFAALNRLRDCNTSSTLDNLGICPPSSPFADAVHMCFRRVTAHNRNTERLARLPGRGHTVSLRDGAVALKEGCDVIVTSNRAGGGFINGSRAKFSGVSTSGEILLDDNIPLKMLADGNWANDAFHAKGTPDSDAVIAGQFKLMGILARVGALLEEDAKKWINAALLPNNSSAAALYSKGYVQFQPYWPILPGYAITVHRAQGMTLPGVIVEEDCFWSIAPARLPYVALSRVADEATVSLNGFLPSSARVRPDPNYPAILNRITGWSNT